MNITFILPSLTEAGSPRHRPIKYSLFPPLGLATLAAFCKDDDEVRIIDQHVEALDPRDCPDIVAIQVYITNAKRAYRLADVYRRRGAHVILGGLHVTSLPQEALRHADTVFLGPAEATFPQFLADYRRGRARRVYASPVRTLVGVPPPRRDLIRRERYLVPNSLVVSRGCPHHCDFCYKDAFFRGGRSFYTQAVDEALAEIDRLPGKHMYFLDDHLFGHRRFARELFTGMEGLGRVFQGAATVDSILRDDLVEHAARAGLRSLFVGFESLDEQSLVAGNKRQNLGRDYREAIARLHELGIMINGSFVFGLDGDGPDVFARTVDWAIDTGITTSTFHIATPYPGTALYRRMAGEGRLLTDDWDRYDTRQVVFTPRGMSIDTLQAGYDRAYRDFYRWSAILRASLRHESVRHGLKHFFYAGGWKKAEPFWNMVIQLKALNQMTPVLEAVLARVGQRSGGADMTGTQEVDFVDMNQ